MHKFSPEAIAYFREYLAWAEAGAPDNTFNRRCGLCTNAPTEAIATELHCHFGGFPVPFNTLTRTYGDDAENRSHHTNPLRLQFLRDQIATA